MERNLTLGMAAFFGVLALAVVIRLGNEALAVIVGMLLGVIAIVPFGLILLAATERREHRQERPTPPVIVFGGGLPQTAVGHGVPDFPLRPWDEAELLPMPSEREFHIVGEE